MAIRVVRLGSPRLPNEGLRLGTVRRPPRGVRKEHHSKLDYYDVWLPELSPSAELLSWALAKPFTASRWNTFAKRYAAELRQPASQHLISLFVNLSETTDFSVG